MGDVTGQAPNACVRSDPFAVESRCRRLGWALAGCFFDAAEVEQSSLLLDLTRDSRHMSESPPGRSGAAGRFSRASTCNSSRVMTRQRQTLPPVPVLGRILLYVRDLDAVAEFYALHFGFGVHREEGDRVVELENPAGAGSNIMLHPLGRGRKGGQTVAKLVFDVPDVEEFCARAAEHGLSFGTVHKADGYVFANAKDPAGNAISISGRAYRHGILREDCD